MTIGLKNPNQPCPYKRRRLVLVYLVNDKGVPAQEAIDLVAPRRRIKEFVSAYNRFLEQLEGAFEVQSQERNRLRPEAGRSCDLHPDLRNRDVWRNEEVSYCGAQDLG